MEYYSAIKKEWDFSGGPVVENLPASAEDTGLIPGLGRVPHAMEQLHVYYYYWAHAPRDHAPQQEKPPQWEAHVLPIDSSPFLLQVEKACV